MPWKRKIFAPSPSFETTWTSTVGITTAQRHSNFYTYMINQVIHIYHHHHHHVPEGLGMFPVPWSSRWSWSLHLFLSRPMFLRPFGLYCSVCFGSLFVSILCTCCSHFFWYSFISFTMFCAPVFCLIHWFFSLSSLRFTSLYIYICVKYFGMANIKKICFVFRSSIQFVVGGW